MAPSGEKKKVLLAITKSNFGGAQRYVYDIARLLDQTLVEVTVVCGGNGVLNSKLQHEGIRTIEIQGLSRDIRMTSDLIAFISFIKTLRRERPDVLHLNSSKMGLMGVVAGRLCGVPRIIFTAHGWPFNEERRWFSRFVLKLLAHFTILLSHHVITVSRAIARDVDPNLRMKKLSIIHNGVESEEMLTKNDARRALVPSHASDEFWFGTIAELHPIKGLSYAIEAFRRYAITSPQARYIIIGDGEERAQLQTQINAAGLENRISLCGFQEHASRFLPAFDVFVLPSIAEGLSFAILEAGAAHLPVIASSVGGIPEIIEDRKSGILVAPKDVDALHRAFEHFATNHAFRESAANALSLRIDSFFSLKAMFEKTFALYQLT